MLGGFYLGHLYLGASGGIASGELTVQDAHHSHDTVEVLIHQIHKLSAQSALHGHQASGGVILVEHKTLSVLNTLHGHTAQGVVLAQKHILQPSNTKHYQFADSVNLHVFLVMAVQNSIHGHTATSPSISQYILLNKPDDTLHGVSSGNVNISQKLIINADDAIHAHSAMKILRILDLTKLGIGYGIYKPDGGDSGVLEVYVIDDNNIYKPRGTSGGQLGNIAIETPGRYKPDSFESGIY